MPGPAHPESANYTETIQQAAIGERKFIRYYAGRGHFAHLRLQLLPRLHKTCLVTKSEQVEIPEPCYRAARASLFRKMESGPIHGFPMLGVEARILGGTFLPRHSYPEAFAQAASMAFDEAIILASPVLMERWCGFTLRVQPELVRQTLETLTRLLGKVTATISLQQYFTIRSQAPASLLAEFRQVFKLRSLETYSLPAEQQYRMMTDYAAKRPPHSSALNDWT